MRKPEMVVTVEGLADTMGRLLSAKRNSEPRIRKTRPGVSQDTKDRMELILELFSLGLSHNQIAKEIGVSREYVRQLWIRMGQEPVSKIKRRESEVRIKFPIRNFYSAMIRHLHEAGFYRCCHCGWQERCKFSPTLTTICTSCNAVRGRNKYRNDPEWRKHIREYNKRPERKVTQKRATDRYIEKLKATPEGLERLREKNRRQYQRYRERQAARANKAKGELNND